MNLYSPGQSHREVSAEAASATFLSAVPEWLLHPAAERVRGPGSSSEDVIFRMHIHKSFIICRTLFGNCSAI